MFTAASFTLPKLGSSHDVLQQVMDKLWSRQQTHSALTRNKLSSHGNTQGNHKCARPREGCRVKGSILHDADSVTFGKRQNHGGGKKTGGCQGLGRRNEQGSRGHAEGGAHAVCDTNGGHTSLYVCPNPQNVSTDLDADSGRWRPRLAGCCRCPTPVADVDGVGARYVGTRNLLISP